MDKVKLTLVGLDGNAFSIMGAFSTAARRQGFDKKYIDDILADAMSGDYNHLLATIANECEDIDGQWLVDGNFLSEALKEVKNV